MHAVGAVKVKGEETAKSRQSTTCPTLSRRFFVLSGIISQGRSCRKVREAVHRIYMVCSDELFFSLFLWSFAHKQQVPPYQTFRAKGMRYFELVKVWFNYDDQGRTPKEVVHKVLRAGKDLYKS